jgi:hypothetical protein
MHWLLAKQFSHAHSLHFEHRNQSRKDVEYRSWQTQHEQFELFEEEAFFVTGLWAALRRFGEGALPCCFESINEEQRFLGRDGQLSNFFEEAAHFPLMKCWPSFLESDEL